MSGLNTRISSSVQVHTFTNKQTEASLRVASIEYLGIITAKLRRDSVSSRLDRNVIVKLISDLEISTREEETPKEENEKKEETESGEKSEDQQPEKSEKESKVIEKTVGGDSDLNEVGDQTV